MKKIFILIVLCFAVSSFLRVHAGGPLVVKSNMAVTYGNRPLLYRYDKGSLGRLSNSEAISIIEPLYGEWQAIKTSEMRFQRDNPGSLAFDVDATNYDSILNSKDLLGYTAVIFDTDGSLLSSFLGDGSGNQVLGLSGPVTVSSGPLVNQIAESQAIFNGRFVDGIDTPSNPESTIDSFKGTIIHETGHGIGLDHSQINVEAISPGASQEIRDSVPLEFPVAVNDLFLIRRDDISSISLLYPNESELTKYGKITGRVLKRDGKTPVLGANVIARNTNNPLLEAISCVSDFLTNGSGEFTLFAVPPGDYRIEVEPIDLSFTGGSGVGPYTGSKTDKSFQDPVVKGFYTGPSQPITTSEKDALVVSVASGQTVSGVDIIGATSIIPSSSSGGTNNINEIEPNDLLSAPQLVTLPVTISGQASSTDSGEVEVSTTTGNETLVISDLYQFTITQTSSLTALLTIESDLQDNDLDLVLFNQYADQILESSSQTGNSDELINKSLKAGTYLLGIGAFSGSTSYKLAISAEATGIGIPSVTLTGSDTLILKPVGANKTMIKASAFNFNSKSKCFITSSNESFVKIKPSVFSLSPAMLAKNMRVVIKRSHALDLISNNKEEDLTVSIICDNGASDEFDIHLTPTADSVARNKAPWQILKK
ncbi:MAG: hypothetical protein HYY52_02750 [Candidatus Melainabacteria bacterium]|nr:hypothetical protein [Candidatus Melainabacteria bacterium]